MHKTSTAIKTVKAAWREKGLVPVTSNATASTKNADPTGSKMQDVTRTVPERKVLIDQIIASSNTQSLECVNSVYGVVAMKYSRTDDEAVSPCGDELWSGFE